MTATEFWWLIYNAAARICDYSASDVITAGGEFGEFSLGSGMANLKATVSIIDGGYRPHAIYTLDGQVYRVEILNDWFPQDQQQHRWVGDVPSEAEAMKIKLNS